MGKLRIPKRFTGNGKYEIVDLARDLMHTSPDYHEDAVVTVEMKPRHSAAAIFLDGKDYGWVDVYEYTHDNGDVYYAIAWSGNSVVFGEFFLDLDNDLTNNQWDALTDGESVPVTLELA